MAKQINCRMTREDERKFVEFARSTGKVAIFKAVQVDTMLNELADLPIQGEPFWFSLCLWNKDFSPPPRLSFVSEQNYFCVEESESEVIQFHRSGIEDGRITRGRI